MRTNIVIDDNLMKEALAVSEASTKKEVVEKALKLLLDVSKQGSIAKYKGQLKWEGDLTTSRMD